MFWGVDLFFKNNSKTLMKNYFASILSYSSKARKSMKMTSAGKKTPFRQNTYYRLLLWGIFLSFLLEEKETEGIAKTLFL